MCWKYNQYNGLLNVVVQLFVGTKRQHKGLTTQQTWEKSVPNVDAA